MVSLPVSLAENLVGKSLSPRNSMKNDILDLLWYTPLAKAGRAIPIASPDLNVLK